jgi:hypothetical protein
MSSPTYVSLTPRMVLHVDGDATHGKHPYQHQLQSELSGVDVRLMGTSPLSGFHCRIQR